ncbi:MAG: EAL domain-containing protein [Parvibaculaceae bacterium]|nr:EAL domain-containing protein [Parvibaculaceae bacterium]
MNVPWYSLLTCTVVLLVSITFPALAVPTIELDPEAEILDITDLVAYIDPSKGVVSIEAGDAGSSTPSASTGSASVDVEKTIPNAVADKGNAEAGVHMLEKGQKGAKPDAFQLLTFAIHNPLTEPQSRLIFFAHSELSGSGLLWPTRSGVIVEAVRSTGRYATQLNEVDGGDQLELMLAPGETAAFLVKIVGKAPERLYMWDASSRATYIVKWGGFTGAVFGFFALLFIALISAYTIMRQPILLESSIFVGVSLLFVCAVFSYPQVLFGLSPDVAGSFRFLLFGAYLITLLVFVDRFLGLSYQLGLVSNVAKGVAGVAGAGAFISLVWPELGGLLMRSVALVMVFGGPLVLLRLSGAGVSRARHMLPAVGVLAVAGFSAGMFALGWFPYQLWTPLFLTGLQVVATVLMVQAVMRQVDWRLLGDPTPIEAAAYSTYDEQLDQSDKAHEEGNAEELPQPIAQTREESALAGAQLGIWDWNIQDDELYVSPFIEATLGLPQGALNGPELAWRECMHPADREIYRTTLNAYIAEGDAYFSINFRMRNPEGEYDWLSLTATAVSGDAEYAVRCVGAISDITDQKFVENRLRHDTLHDGVTSLPNRALFLDRMDRAIQSAKGNNGAKVNLVLFDLDRFRAVNESLGHAVGDMLLAAIARRVELLVSKEDTLSRLQGDEFAILLTSQSSREDILAFSASLADVLSQPMVLAGQEIFPAASLGIALCEDYHERAQDLLKDAETALYQAKSQGKAVTLIFDPEMRQESKYRLPMESDLRRALERDELEVFYQPIMSLEENRVAGFEALIRWNHPELGLLLPDDFIPLAEETGIIVPLGRFVMEQATQDLQLWQTHFPIERPIFASINISSRQLFRHDLTQDVREVLNKTEIAPGTMRLEVTETLVMENPELAARSLTQIKELGAGISLDDFGTGYSSLSYLQRFPFDSLKLDRSFIARLEQHSATRTITQTVISLAHGLNMSLIAEGIETVEQQDLLAEMGCDYVQGFYYGVPMNAREALDFIAMRWRD